MMKLIACDLDGTLLDGNHGLSDKSKAVSVSYTHLDVYKRQTEYHGSLYQSTQG